MNIKMICSLRYCTLLNNVIDFNFSTAQLIPNTEYLNAGIFTQHVIDQIGQINIREFINAPFFFSFVEIENEDDLAKFTIKIFSALGVLTSFLWFSKDNCIDLGMMYTYPADSDGRVLSRYKTASTSKADGSYTETEINNEDLKLAENISLRIQELQNKNTDSKISPAIPSHAEKPIISDTNYHFKDYNESNRIQRALSFLVMARSNSFLPLKISLYIAVLETIFTTDSTEVNYKVCQRVAFYLEKDYEIKFRIFNQVKEAYDIRSKFFHGQELKKNKDTRDHLSKVSQSIDDIIRKILLKVLFEDSDIFLQKDKELSEYYNQLIFK